MKTKLTLLAVTALMLGTGCATTVRVGPKPGPDYNPPPPPPVVVVQQPMTYDEAVRLGISYANNRGFNANVKEAHMTGNNVWKVHLAVYRGDERGKMKLDYDAHTRALLKADEKVKAHGNKHDRDDDDDDDDDHEHGASAVGHGNGSGNGNGHGKDKH